jgi:hypothetical protein
MLADLAHSYILRHSAEKRKSESTSASTQLLEAQTRIVRDRGVLCGSRI